MGFKCESVGLSLALACNLGLMTYGVKNMTSGGYKSVIGGVINLLRRGPRLNFIVIAKSNLVPRVQIFIQTGCIIIYIKWA